MRTIALQKKSLTTSLAIVAAAVGMAAVPVQTAHADGNCTKTGSPPQYSGDVWRCTNMFGYARCDFYTGPYPSVVCTGTSRPQPNAPKPIGAPR